MADHLRTYLAQHPFFVGLSDAQLNLVASLATGARYGAQQRVFKHDTDASQFYVLRDGKVGVEIPAVSGEPLRIQTVGNGGVLGWSWLIPPYRWLFDARALSPSEIVVIDGARLRSECEQDPRLGYELLKRFAALMAERLNASRLAAIRHYTGGFSA
ncbi:MAG TPA: cyclic nucleotide-binding domain-containing protein [Polyangiales bacterium]|nr:cyclic nucleotide-binding domain-containing protein [Polyangiales bacterium]